MKNRAFALMLLLVVVPFAGCASDEPATPTTVTPATPTSSPTPVVPVVGIAFADDFEGPSVAGIPAGWTVVSGNWSLLENESAPSGAAVFASAQTELTETLAIADAAASWSDLNASVMFNVQGGEKGQAGGIAFRYVDAKNYYVVRYNHNELQWNLFRTLDGNRQKFPGTEESANFTGSLDTWTELHLVAIGSNIQVFSGGLKVLDFTETKSGAPTSGKVGLWTRYDSKTEFDAFSVGPIV